MILTDFSKIKFGSADIKAVYAGSVKIWPVTSGDTGDRRTMRFTTTDGNTWNKDNISAYTADNRLIEPTEKTSTGWTYAEDVEYLASSPHLDPQGNLLTFNGFDGKIKISSANSLFSNENQITEIDTEKLDVSEANILLLMFYNCKALTSLDVSHFNTSNATNMSTMFMSCSSLASLNLSNWNTSKVTDMSGMFNDCNALTTLDLSRFNTSSVTDMQNMFKYCSSLTSLDLGNWDTSNVTNMSNMFYGCNKLTSLDLSNWDLTNVTNMSGMFSGCGFLRTITMKNCSTETVNKIKSVVPPVVKIITE